jgi:tetratricopeptide (TPR) repeat protein
MSTRTCIAARLALAWAFLFAAVPAQGLTEAERNAFDLKSRARYPEALDAFLELIGSAAPTLEGAARAESHVVVASLLAARLGAMDRATAFEALATADRPAGLRDALLLASLNLHHAAGRHEDHERLARELGFLTRFQISGPFDNERGAGYGRAFGPEGGFDPGATFDGKARPVGWRELPVATPPAGVIVLGAMLRPSEQVLAYAATALVAEQPTRATLLLGTSGSFRVFLNGREVAQRDVRRQAVADQDAVVLPLRSGPNLLVLKVCAQDERPAFLARLRGPDGGPCAGVEESMDPAILVRASATVPVDAGELQIPRRAVDVLADSAAGGNPADAFAAATLLALRQPDDPTERRDRALAEQAVAGLPDFTAARYLLAFTRVQAGRAEEKDENARRRDYETILAQDPRHAEALRSLAEMELEDVGAAESCEELCRRALEVSPGFSAARLLWARALDALELDPLAFDQLLLAAAPNAAGAVDPEAARRSGEALASAGRHRDAVAAFRTSLVGDQRPAAAIALADVLLRHGDTAEALAALRSSVRANPFADAPRRRIARVLEGEGDLDAAASELRDWLEICPEDDTALVALARLAGLRGEPERRLELLRAAITLNPNLEAQARLVAFLEADEMPFHAAFELDADPVLAEWGTPPTDATEANDAHYWVLQQDVVRAYDNGTRSVYQHRIVRILSDRSTRQFATWVVPHNRQDQRARVLSARVMKADGRELRPRLRGAFVQLPPLEIGDVVDVRARIDDVAPSFFGQYFGLVHPFAAPDGQPVGRSELVLLLEPGRSYQSESRHGAPEPSVEALEDGTSVRRYAMTGLARATPEERAPGYKETAPLVRVTTYADWDAFASWWWNLIRRQSDVSPAMRDKVAEITAGLPTNAERIRAVYDFVTNDVRYKAWEFGVHGYKPYNTSVIFERRHGDCKDKALLLNAMLGELGIEAYPVLIWAEPGRDVDDLSLAMVEHFNHCISYLPAGDGYPAMFLDGTATWHTTDTVPEMDQGARVLVVRGTEGALEDVPWVAADANVDARTYTLSVAPNGTGRISMVATPDRNQEVSLRGFLAQEPARRAENLERMLAGSFGSVEVTDVQATDPTDLATPVRLEVQFDGRDVAVRQGNGLSLRGAFDAQPLQGLTAAPERETPLVLGAPESARQVIRYRLPDGYKPVGLPEPVALDAPFGRYALTWRMDGQDIVVERTRSLSVPRIEAQEYPGFREFAAQADAADARTVLVRPEGR